MNKETYTQLYNAVHHVQDVEEFYWLISEVEKLNPNIIIEIGVHHGGSLKFWEQILKPGDLLIGIDYEPQIDWDWEGSDREIVIIKGRSELSSTVERVKEILGERKADFAFLDGSHEYDIVKKDFNNFSPLLRVGGLIAIHDINTQREQAGRFFAELEAEYPDATDKMLKVQGTGVWYKP